MGVLASRLLTWRVTRDLAARAWLGYMGWYVRSRTSAALDAHRLEGPPDGGEWNRVLKKQTDVDAATRYLRSLDVGPHFDRAKNWDLARSLSFITRKADRDVSVLDIGCGWWGGMLLPDLARLGFRRLYGCDPLLPFAVRVGPIAYHDQDFFSVRFPSKSFDFAACLSVIEHGMDQREFIQEVHRVLKPDGYLLLSTDYWVTPLAGVESRPGGPFGRPWRPFDEPSLARLLQAGRANGLVPIAAPDLAVAERVVKWRQLSYTFVFLVMRREAHGVP